MRIDIFQVVFFVIDLICVSIVIFLTHSFWVLFGVILVGISNYFRGRYDQSR